MFTARQLSDGEVTLAQLLLQAAATFIRDACDEGGLPEPPPDDPMAKLVSFEVVRDALQVPADLAQFTSYQRATDDRSEGGTLAVAGDLLDITENHRRMLGLSLAAAPQSGGFCSGFGQAGFGEDSGYRYANSPAGPVLIGQVAIGEGWP